MEEGWEQRQQPAISWWQFSWQLCWTPLLIRYGSLATEGCIPDRQGRIRGDSWPWPETPNPTASESRDRCRSHTAPELCECCRSHTVLSIHGSNKISGVSSQVQTLADWKPNKNRTCIRIQGIRVNSGAPACYRCLSCGLQVYVA